MQRDKDVGALAITLLWEVRCYRALLRRVEGWLEQGGTDEIAKDVAHKLDVFPDRGLGLEDELPQCDEVGR